VPERWNRAGDGDVEHGDADMATTPTPAWKVHPPCRTHP
jgi:hypothetical protein